MTTPRAYILLTSILAAVFFYGCAGPLKLNYETMAGVQQAELKQPVSIRIGPFTDARKGMDGFGDPRTIGTINSTVLNMTGSRLVLADKPATLLRDAFVKEFAAAGYTVITDNGPAQFSLTGEVRAFQLDIGSRDEISIEIFTEIKEVQTGTVIWSGPSKVLESRYAGTAGNSKGSISRYITATLSKAIRQTILAATPELTGTSARDGSQREDVKTREGARGRLQITSDPSRVKVYLDSVYYGLTPLDLELAPGIYDLVLRKEGFAESRERVAVGMGRTTELESTLEGTKRLPVK